MQDKKAKKKKKRPFKKCATKFCRTQTRNKFCYKHEKQNWAKSHPIEYTFANLKQNAKRRGKEFSLTIEEFREFCEKNNYIKFKGRNSNSFSIDRIRVTEGYHKDNIRIITCAQNTRKMHDEYKNMGTMPINYKVFKYTEVHYDPLKDKKAHNRINPGDDNFVPF